MKTKTIVPNVNGNNLLVIGLGGAGYGVLKKLFVDQGDPFFIPMQAQIGMKIRAIQIDTVGDMDVKIAKSDFEPNIATHRILDKHTGKALEGSASNRMVNLPHSVAFLEKFQMPETTFVLIIGGLGGGTSSHMMPLLLQKILKEREDLVPILWPVLESGANRTKRRNDLSAINDILNIVKKADRAVVWSPYDNSVAASDWGSRSANDVPVYERADAAIAAEVKIIVDLLTAGHESPDYSMLVRTFHPTIVPSKETDRLKGLLLKMAFNEAARKELVTPKLGDADMADVVLHVLPKGKFISIADAAMYKHCLFVANGVGTTDDETLIAFSASVTNDMIAEISAKILSTADNATTRCHTEILNLPEDEYDSVL